MLSQRRGAPVAPAARFDKLVVTETADEVLIYDTEKHHIHHLNATTAAVWRLCDGRNTVGDIAHLAGQAMGVSMDEATVRLALTKLDDAGLFQQSLMDELRMSRMSRRTFMQRAAVAGAVAVPAIASTTASVGATFSEPLCGEGCDPLAERNCVQPGCTGCLNGQCVTDAVACTYVNSGYKSIPCDDAQDCHAAFRDGTFVRPPGANNENCSGTGQVPGLGKGCCVGNNQSGPPQCGVTPCADDAQCTTWFGASCGVCLPGGVCGAAQPIAPTNGQMESQSIAPEELPAEESQLPVDQGQDAPVDETQHLPEEQTQQQPVEAPVDQGQQPPVDQGEQPVDQGQESVAPTGGDVQVPTGTEGGAEVPVGAEGSTDGTTQDAGTEGGQG